MTYSVLAHLDSVRSELVEAIRPRKPGTLVQVEGGWSSGKSSLLRLALDDFRTQGWLPVLVAPPARAEDAGVLALAQSAVGLAAGNRVNGEFRQILAEQGAWSDKLAALKAWLVREQGRAVVLCDEPDRWFSDASGDDGHFAQLTRETFDVLRESPAPKVFTGLGRWTATKKISVPAQGNPSDFLRAPDTWGMLQEVARRIADLGEARLRWRSPLELRLIVGLGALLSPEEVVRWLDMDRPRRWELSRRLVETLEQRNTPDALGILSTWGRLSLVRRAIPQDLLPELRDPALNATAAAVLEHCILYPDNGGYVLHDTLRADAQERGHWLGKDECRDSHRHLAEHYRQQFAGREPEEHPRALLDECEAFHHASRTGDRDFAQGVRVRFVEQLNILGRVLSRDFHKYVPAADVFARACERDPDNDYSRHYLAFNLDIAAHDAPRAEENYRRAIDLAPWNVWWRSRWISYLVTRGRTAAAREAWFEALDAIRTPFSGSPPEVYENLHLWVARLLLHRGQLDFAEAVLQDIPPAALDEHFGLRALRRRLQALLEVRRNRAVFPLTVPEEGKWTRPHLFIDLPPGDIVAWLAGRVDEVDPENGIHLSVAKAPQAPGQEPEYGFLDLDFAEFDAMAKGVTSGELAAGRYVEIVWLKQSDEGSPLLRAHLEQGWEDPDLPPLFPNPARYLRRAGWVRSRA